MSLYAADIVFLPWRVGEDELRAGLKPVQLQIHYRSIWTSWKSDKNIFIERTYRHAGSYAKAFAIADAIVIT